MIIYVSVDSGNHLERRKNFTSVMLEVELKIKRAIEVVIQGKLSIIVLINQRIVQTLMKY